MNMRWFKRYWRTAATYVLAFALGWIGCAVLAAIAAPDGPALIMPPGTRHAVAEVPGAGPSTVLDSYFEALVEQGWERAGSTGQTLVERSGGECTNLRISTEEAQNAAGQSITRVIIDPAPFSC
ncbi:MAG TPA: hypothetical protein VGE07_02500 [Herpetosiphonaceae bacterium]